MPNASAATSTSSMTVIQIHAVEVFRGTLGGSLTGGAYRSIARVRVVRSDDRERT